VLLLPLAGFPQSEKKPSAQNLGGQGKTGHLSTLQNRPLPVSGIEAD
jgi:hypothetical protein